MRKKPRTEIRHLVDIRVEIGPFPTRDGRRLGSVRDLAFRGMRVRVDGHVEAGDRLPVQLHVPGPEPLHIELLADVRWTEPLSDGQTVAGLEFLHTPHTRTQVDDLLVNLQSGRIKEIERRRAAITLRRVRTP